MENQEPVIKLNGYSISNINYKGYNDTEDLESLDIEDGSVSLKIRLTTMKQKQKS